MNGWTKIARKHYRHDATLVELRYDHNRYGWEVIGGQNDGMLRPRTLWIAMHQEAGTPAEWA